MKRRIFIVIDRCEKREDKLEKIDKVFLIIKKHVTEYFQSFGHFFRRVLLLFTQDYVETALFILFCTIITAAMTSLLKKLLIKAMMFVSGVTYIAQPGGSIRDDNVIDTCNKYNMTMAFTGIRLFHH